MAFAAFALALVQESAARLWIEARDGASSSRPLAGVEAASLSELGAVALRVEGLAPPPEPPPSPNAVEVRLASGDPLRGTLIGGEGDRVEIELAGGTRLGLDVDRLARLEFPAHAAASARQAYEPAPSGDRLYWIRGTSQDRVDGTLESFRADGVAFESKLGSRVFPWSEVAALFVEALGPAKAPEPGPRRVCVEIAGGGRLRAELKKLDANTVALDLGQGQSASLAWNSIAELVVDDGSVRFLSDLAPARAVEGWLEEGEPGMRWPFQLDRAQTGEPLRAGGRSWSRGIGVHAPSRLEFELDGSWKSLRGSVAIDDSVRLLPYRGSVVFSLFAGERAEPLWTSGRVQGGEAPLALPALDLTGVRRLALVVDMDERSFIADRADWLRMLLVR